MGSSTLILFGSLPFFGAISTLSNILRLIVGDSVRLESVFVDSGPAALFLLLRAVF